MKKGLPMKRMQEQWPVAFCVFHYAAFSKYPVLSASAALAALVPCPTPP